MFFRIPRKEDPVQANNVGNKFNNELNRIFVQIGVTDWCQIMDIRTVGNGPKILSRSFYLEDTPQYKDVFQQKQSESIQKTGSSKIPNPVVTFAGQFSGVRIPASIFRQQTQLVLSQPKDNGYAGTCDITSFNFAYIPKDKDPIFKRNEGAAFAPEFQKIIEQAKDGDLSSYLW